MGTLANTICNVSLYPGRAQPYLLGGDMNNVLAGTADAILAAGYRQIFDGDCGLSNIKDPSDKEAAEAWMRWTNLINIGDGEPDGIGAMKQMLMEFGYRKPRTIETVEELDALPDGAIILEPHGTPTRAVKRQDGKNWWVDGPDAMSASALIPLPATVLYEPIS